MEAQEKIALNEENIRQAIEDYGRHTSQTAVLDNVSYAFITRLAKDNYYEKQELRGLFRKSPVWDETLDALVINGTRTHNPDYARIRSLAGQILYDVEHIDSEQFSCIFKVINFFSNPNLTDDEKAESIAAIQKLAPKAYAPGKKPSRIFRALCVALGIDDNTCERFSWKYAQLADEMSSREIDFKLFVSLNPAHFITMSNPKQDERGDTLTSCHSFNSTEYPYNNGCSGYARDKYTFIVFTVVDPSNAETLNNRKNMRQIFCYKPGNGVLLQSRLYNDAGGVNREQAESKLYRDLIQREISDLEEQPNLWKTFKYYGNNKISLDSGEGFGGYQDWTCANFCAKVSIRADHENNYSEFEIGTWGICISCGELIDEGLYCDDCSCVHACHMCGEHLHEDDVFIVNEEEGVTIEVCVNCRDRYYTYCDECSKWYPQNTMAEIFNGDWVCSRCLEDNYIQCDFCGEWVRKDDIRIVLDDYGDKCVVCSRCIRGYQECKDCGRLFKSYQLVDGRCPDCMEKNKAEKVENVA